MYDSRGTTCTVVLIIFATRLRQKPLVNRAFVVSELKPYVDGEAIAVHVWY